MPATRVITHLASLALLSAVLSAQDAEHAALQSEFGPYGHNGLSFFGQACDARGLGAEWPPDNLTPRGIILHLGHGIHACFDPDLLRLALVWKENAPGEYLAMNGMAPGSYRQPHRKAPAGQSKLPTPIGTPLLANGLYRGIQIGATAALRDPREPSLDKTEPGLGPLPPKLGRWLGLRLDPNGPTLVYEIHGIRIEEQLTFRDVPDNEAALLCRELRIGPHAEPLTVVESPEISLTIPPCATPQRWSIPIWISGGSTALFQPRGETLEADEPAPAGPGRFWAQALTQSVAPPPPATGPFAIEEIPLPLPNPWKRNVRPSDFDFFPDGRLALLTFDGDVWLADGIERSRTKIVWRRFASGLHEPMGLRVVENELVVFDRNGLVRLLDRDRNGEADYYENLSSLPSQTAETREFAMGLALKPGGGYYLAKGGQVAGTRGKHNGTLVEVSPDGKELAIVATGLRQPLIGVDPLTGLLTASDQQGHWKPATPIHVIKPGDYYGFQPSMFGPDANEGREIVEPPIWIPHFLNQSGARQVWLRNARMGPLNDSLIHLGYNRPALFKVFLEDDHTQGAVVPLLDGFPTGLLSGRVNPSDGLLYVGGLNLWGTVGKKIQGLYRIRPTGEPSWVPREVRVFAEGVLLRFDHPLDAALVTNPAGYTIDRWNYVRSHQYGSGHFKLNGEPGQDSLAVASVALSRDQRAVFLGIPGMAPVHSLRVTYRPAANRIDNAYLTVHRLTPADPPALGFAEGPIDLTPKTAAAGPPHPKPTAAQGREIAELYGCVGCHSIDGSRKVAEDPGLVVGPGWKGLFGSQREFTDGTVLKQADEVYLRESILDPSRNVTKGFETGETGVGMPSYLGVLRDDQIDSLILFIKSLE